NVVSGVKPSSKAGSIDTPQSAQKLDRFIKPLPALFVVHTDNVIVARRGTRSQTDEQSPIGKNIYGGQRLSQWHRTTYDWQGHARPDCHASALREHGCKSGRRIEPRPRVDQVVVGRNRFEAQFGSGF